MHRSLQVLTRYIIQTAVPMNFLTVKWLNMHRLSVMDVRISILHWYRISVPNCDCHGENDAPILPDIGMFASFDPGSTGSGVCRCLSESHTDCKQPAGRTFGRGRMALPSRSFTKIPIRISSGKATLDQAEKIGLGTREYELKIIK